MATMKDVALRAGVSTATVSRVLNGHTAPTPETRDRVLAAVDELGYRPNALARSLRMHRTKTLGLVVSDLLNPFFAEIARAVEDEARAHGYCVVFGNADENDEQQATYVRTLLDRQVDGLLVCPATDDGSWVAEVAQRGVPLVLLDRTVTGATVPVVRADGSDALRELAGRLVAVGHRRIGVIAGPEDTSTGRERLHAFAAALAALGQPLADDHVRHGDFRRASGAAAAAALLALPEPPTVLVAMDNLMGLGALEELRRANLSVPGDVGLAVYDDQLWFPLLDQPITVIAQPTVEMGSAAVRSLLALISGEQPTDVRLTARLIARGSCGEGVPRP
ncbi:LacI family DNA-binding transcriptional regulator [Goodfellowiella coeruleoviolacea]|uniref:Transcriptional regulator, LacI family n=1 Tax=Goodfellowiella coeruleoviolacea TaxID=334858 RepID=A0AAE3GKJ5_9PSEU|nr:LacI family DNA-binding transcriptional regulator [Goodfellowiella coeruleoviolacea]MCP2168939.1 transcriptional regulator, LacI family [Goodfellowiella coeruleoviolacea]